ncbi:hypothetical protein [uncultured Sphingomonas sp.]|nr:hypothetical protein [uncultured Sphingomonas sp.]
MLLVHAWRVMHVEHSNAENYVALVDNRASVDTLRSVWRCYARRLRLPFQGRCGMMKILSGLAASALVLAPISATAAPAASASKLSVASSARVGTATGKSDRAVAGGGIIAAVLAAAIVVGGIVLIADNDDDSDSN